MPDPPRAIRKHPRAVRWMHWVNVPLLTVMIWSGLLIYRANDVSRIGWGDGTLVAFFPDGFYEALSLTQRLAKGMAYHYFFAVLFTLNGIGYVLSTAIRGEWRHLVPDRQDGKDAFQVVLHALRKRLGADAMTDRPDDPARLGGTPDPAEGDPTLSGPEAEGVEVPQSRPPYVVSAPPFVAMPTIDRITQDPAVMGGRACIRGTRVTVGTVLGLLASGRSPDEVVAAYPYLERADIDAALTYASWRAEEVEVALRAA